MIDYAGMVREWHEKFGVPVLDKPTVIDEDRRKLRIELIREEFREYSEASDAGNLVAIADGLGDMLYVIHGAAHEWGIPIDRVFAEIQRSNMSKTWLDGSVRKREDGKILKPPTYSPADIKSIIDEAINEVVNNAA